MIQNPIIIKHGEATEDGSSHGGIIVSGWQAAEDTFQAETVER